MLQFCAGEFHETISLEERQFSLPYERKISFINTRGEGEEGARGVTYVIQNNKQKSINFCEKSQFKSVSCCRFLFCCKNQDRFEVFSKKQGIYISKLDA